MTREMKEVGLPWLKEIPASWHAAKLKHFTSYKLGVVIQDKDSYTKQGGGYVPYIAASDLDKDQQAIVHKGDLFTPENDSRFPVAYPGSILTLIRGDCGKKSALVKKPCSYSSSVAEVKIKDPKRLDLNFLYYLFTSDLYAFYISATMDRFLPGVSFTTLGNFSFPLPPLEEQKKIAVFLDKRVKTITQLILAEKKRVAKYKELIKILHKKVIFNEDDDLINTLFNGNRKLAESKGFHLGKIRDLFKRVKEQASADDTIFVCGFNGKAYPKGDKRLRESAISDGLYLFQKVEKGQLFFSSLNLNKGAVAIAPENGSCSKRNHCLKPIKENVNIKYFYYFFRATAFLDLYIPFANTIRVDSLGLEGWNKAGKLPILYPSSEEQERIVNFLDYALGEAEQEIADSLNLIDKLTNLKTSLISEALTGKIDVIHFDLKDLISQDSTLDTTDSNSLLDEDVEDYEDEDLTDLEDENLED